MTTRKLRQLASRANTIAANSQALHKIIREELPENTALINDSKIATADAWEVCDHLKGLIPINLKKK
jgi:hypothetical protein